MAELGFGVIEIDLDHPADVSAPAGLPWALIVGRQAGVPVGSCHLAIDSFGHHETVAARLVRRRTPPPGPIDRCVAVTVAICTRDRPDRLRRCLRSINAAAAVADGEAELDLLVIDNGSADDLTRRVVLEAGGRWVREPVPGLDVARNRAVRESASDVVAFVDDDVVVDRAWLRTVVRSFAQHAGLAALSGHVLAYALDSPARIEFERTGGFSLGWTPTVFTAPAGEVPFRPDIGVGCNMAFRRGAIELVGPFDEALDTGRPLPAGGDLDMMIRMVMAGGVIYEPSAVVFHEHRGEWSALRFQYYTWGKGWAAVLDKWYRTSPRHRPDIRRAAITTLRGYARHIVNRWCRADTYRTSHSLLLAVGFAVGWAGCYRRSVVRMERRRLVHGAIGPPVEHQSRTLDLPDAP